LKSPNSGQSATGPKAVDHDVVAATFCFWRNSAVRLSLHATLRRGWNPVEPAQYRALL